MCSMCHYVRETPSRYRERHSSSLQRLQLGETEVKKEGRPHMLEERPQRKPVSSLESLGCWAERSPGTTGQRDAGEVGSQARL